MHLLSYSRFFSNLHLIVIHRQTCVCWNYSCLALSVQYILSFYGIAILSKSYARDRQTDAEVHLPIKVYLLSPLSRKPAIMRAIAVGASRRVLVWRKSMKFSNRRNWIEISSLLHSVNLILFTALLVHLILRIITSSQSPPSLSSPITASTFHSRSLSQILSSIVTLIPSGLTSRILTCTELKHCLFVLVSGYVC